MGASAPYFIMSWFVYLIECTNGSLYTGITNNVQARFAAHLAGKGAKYTRANPPKKLLNAFECPDKSWAAKAEYHIKQLTPAQKRTLTEQSLKNWLDEQMRVHAEKIEMTLKLPKPSAIELEAARNKLLADLIAPDLKLWFCGINPGLYSAAIGCHFGRPGNRFWPTLFNAGFTPYQFDPHEQEKLLEQGYGLTNLAGRTTAKAAELSKEELIKGRERLVEKLAVFKPHMLAILGVSAYRTAFEKPKAQLGLQPETIVGIPIWVLPSPSGLNAHYQKAELAEAFQDCRLYLEKYVLA